MAWNERTILDTFVELADSLVGDYDPAEFLSTLVTRCAEVLDATSAAVMLESAEGDLRLAAATTAAMEALEQAEIDNEDGPCHQAYRTGEPVVANDLADGHAAERWPSVAKLMRDMGLRAVYAFPLRLRDDRLGALNLYRDTPGAFAEEDVRLAQAFADVATIGIINERKLATAEVRAAQLQTALDTRIVIERAKGVIAVTGDVPFEEAFEMIRRQARRTQRKVRDVAQSVIDEGPQVLDP